MQSVSFRIWTRVTVSISYDNNHYTTVYMPLNKETETETNFPKINVYQRYQPIAGRK